MTRSIAVKAATLLLGISFCGYAISDHPFYCGSPGFGAAQAMIMLAGIALAISATLPLKWNGRILASCMTGLLSLLGAELVCEQKYGDRFRPYFMEHEQRIFTLRPNCTNVFLRSEENGGNAVPWRTNRAGFRGSELPSETLGSRVFVYGDSFVHAPYCLELETFVSRLGVALSDGNGDRVTTLNAGISSYGPDQVYLRLLEDLESYSMDLVIVAIFAGNDYGDIVRNRLFDVTVENALEARKWTLDPEIAADLRLGSRSSMLMTIARRVVKHSVQDARSLRFGLQGFDLMESWLRFAQGDFERSILARDPVIDNIYVDRYDADIALLPSSQSAVYKRRLMHATLSSIVSAARDRRVSIAFVVIPHPIDVCICYDSAQVDHGRYAEYQRTNLTAPIVAQLRELAVPTVDLFEAFWSSGAVDLYFRAGDDHWNEAGQALAATITAKLIIDARLLEK